MRRSARTDVDVAPASAGTARLAPRPVVTALTAPTLGLIVVMFDQIVFDAAVPTILGDIGGGRLLPWAFSGYLLGTTITAPVAGRLSDQVGRGPVLRVAAVVFTAGTLLAASAESFVVLIIARTLQGMAGGSLQMVPSAVLGDVVPGHERPQWQAAIIGSVAAVTLLGPVVVDRVVDLRLWRLGFAVPLPMMLVAALQSRQPHRRWPEPDRRRFDWSGFAVFAGGAVALLVTINVGGAMLASSGLAIIGLCGFVAAWVLVLRRVECDHVDPVVPVHLFRPGMPLAIYLTGFTLGIAQFAVLSYMPTFLQVGLGESPGTAAWVVAPVLLAITVSGALIGRRIARTRRSRLYPVVGSAIFAAAIALQLAISPSTSLMVPALSLIALGTGMGLAGPVRVMLLQEHVPRRDLGSATATLLLMKMLGASVGTALLGGVLKDQFVRRAAGSLASGTDPLAILDRPALVADLAPEAASGVQLAFVAGYHRLLWGALVCAVLAVGAFVWVARNLDEGQHAPDVATREP